MSPVATNGVSHNGIHTNGAVKNKPSETNGRTAEKSTYHASSSEEAIHSEHTYAAHNYHPLPIVFARAQGTKVWDPEGKEYLDFLSAYSAVNQGHCHPELVKALVDQAQRLTLSSRAFYNDVFPRFAEFVTKYFAFDMVLPMNTGAEAVETAVKIARKWGYKVKGIAKDEAMVFSVAENFHGRTVSLRSSYVKVYTYLDSFPRYRCQQIPSRETTMVLICRTLAQSVHLQERSSRSTTSKLCAKLSKHMVRL